MSGNSSDVFSNLVLHGLFTFITFMLMRILILLPLSTYILYLGLQRWRQQRSFKTSSHVDILTYHQSVMELLWITGKCFYYFADNLFIMVTTTWMCSLASYGEMLINVLVCVEQYVAVVHPVIYMKLRNQHGVRIRNISIGFVWFFSFGLTNPQITGHTSSIITLCLLVFFIIMTCFCSLSVLYVLIHPGPGERSGEKKQLDQSKRRALNVIATIMCMQSFWLFGNIVTVCTHEFPQLSPVLAYMLYTSLQFSNLPSCLVLPLFYLYRTGKLTCRGCRR